MDVYLEPMDVDQPGGSTAPMDVEPQAKKRREGDPLDPIRSVLGKPGASIEDLATLLVEKLESLKLGDATTPPPGTDELRQLADYMLDKQKTRTKNMLSKMSNDDFDAAKTLAKELVALKEKADADRQAKAAAAAAAAAVKAAAAAAAARQKEENDKMSEKKVVNEASSADLAKLERLNKKSMMYFEDELKQAIQERAAVLAEVFLLKLDSAASLKDELRKEAKRLVELLGKGEKASEIQAKLDQKEAASAAKAEEEMNKQIQLEEGLVKEASSAMPARLKVLNKQSTKYVEGRLKQAIKERAAVLAEVFLSILDSEGNLNKAQKDDIERLVELLGEDEKASELQAKLEQKEAAAAAKAEEEREEQKQREEGLVKEASSAMPARLKVLNKQSTKYVEDRLKQAIKERAAVLAEEFLSILGSEGNLNKAQKEDIERLLELLNSTGKGEKASELQAKLEQKEAAAAAKAEEEREEQKQREEGLVKEASSAMPARLKVLNQKSTKYVEGRLKQAIQERAAVLADEFLSKLGSEGNLPKQLEEDVGRLSELLDSIGEGEMAGTLRAKLQEKQAAEKQKQQDKAAAAAAKAEENERKRQEKADAAANAFRELVESEDRDPVEFVIRAKTQPELGDDAKGVLRAIVEKYFTKDATLDTFETTLKLFGLLDEKLINAVGFELNHLKEHMVKFEDPLLQNVPTTSEGDAGESPGENELDAFRKEYTVFPPEVFAEPLSDRHKQLLRQMYAVVNKDANNAYDKRVNQTAHVKLSACVTDDSDSPDSEAVQEELAYWTWYYKGGLLRYAHNLVRKEHIGLSYFDRFFQTAPSIEVFERAKKLLKRHGDAIGRQLKEMASCAVGGFLFKGEQYQTVFSDMKKQYTVESFNRAFRKRISKAGFSDVQGVLEWFKQQWATDNFASGCKNDLEEALVKRPYQMAELEHFTEVGQAQLEALDSGVGAPGAPDPYEAYKANRAELKEITYLGIDWSTELNNATEDGDPACVLEHFKAKKDRQLISFDGFKKRFKVKSKSNNFTLMNLKALLDKVDKYDGNPRTYIIAHAVAYKEKVKSVDEETAFAQVLAEDLRPFLSGDAPDGGKVLAGVKDELKKKPSKKKGEGANPNPNPGPNRGGNEGPSADDGDNELSEIEDLINTNNEKTKKEREQAAKKRRQERNKKAKETVDSLKSQHDNVKEVNQLAKIYALDLQRDTLQEEYDAYVSEKQEDQLTHLLPTDFAELSNSFTQSFTQLEMPHIAKFFVTREDAGIDAGMGAQKRKSPENPDGDDAQKEDGPASKVSRLTPVSTGATVSSNKKDKTEIPILAFNTHWARTYLRMHLLYMEAVHAASLEENPGAKFANVPNALDADREKSITKLLPFFKSMVEYYIVMMFFKEDLLNIEIKLENKSRKAKLKKELDKIKKKIGALGNPTLWTNYAKRVLDMDRGKIQGLLYNPQPFFMPLRIYAPPRVGKSATALLAASLAKRFPNMITLYSVSPNKLLPIQELKDKLEKKLNWKEKTSEGVFKYTAKQFVDGDGSNGESDDNLGVKWSKDKCAPADSKVDMFIYSSDQEKDVQNIGAALSVWKYSDKFVFHIRDEAQSIAHKTQHTAQKCVDFDGVLSPVLLNLRHYYGNAYGLNCNVTATHFPTLTEESMWGYFGSCRQNVQAKGKLEINIEQEVGSRYLPALAPALCPTVSAGYIGLEQVEPWSLSYGTNRDKKNEPAFLFGEKHLSASRDSKVSQSGSRESETDKFKKEALVNLLQAEKDSASSEEYILCGAPDAPGAAVDGPKRDDSDNMDNNIYLTGEHFKDWMKDVDVAQNNPSYKMGTTRVIPLYIGALNQKLQGKGLMSVAKLLMETIESRTVAFIIYSSVFTGWSVVEESLPEERYVFDNEGTAWPDCLINAGDEGAKLVVLYCKKKANKIHIELKRALNMEQVVSYKPDDKNVFHYAIMGYSMFKAGLTVQTIREALERGKKIKYNFCPRFMAYVCTAATPLDESLQTVGRCFVDLKLEDNEQYMLDGFKETWKIQLLSIKTLIPALKAYNAAEYEFAHADTVGTPERLGDLRTKGKMLYEVLRSAFPRRLVAKLNLECVGVISKNLISLTSILGIDADALTADKNAVNEMRTRKDIGDLIEEYAEAKYKRQKSDKDLTTIKNFEADDFDPVAYRSKGDVADVVPMDVTSLARMPLFDIAKLFAAMY